MLHNNERRQGPRYDTEVEIYFDINYDLKTKVDFHIMDDAKERPTKKYSALSKNVSSLGLCLTSNKKVDSGHILALDVYLPNAKSPIEMVGEVRWCVPNSKKFDMGLKLLTVEGFDVEKSLNLDPTYHVEWSIVLEKVLGDYKDYVNQRK